VALAASACTGRGQAREATARPAGAPAPAAPPAAAAPIAAVGPDRDALAARFVDRLADCEARTPDLRAAYGRLAWHWQKMPNPWASLTGDRVYRTSTSPSSGGTSRATRAGAARHQGDRDRPGLEQGDRRLRFPHVDLRPGGLRVRLPRDGAPRAYLRFGHAWLVPPSPVPSTGLEFTVLAKDPRGQTPLYTRTVAPPEANEWIDAEIDLSALAGREVTLAFATHGPGGRPAPVSSATRCCFSAAGPAGSTSSSSSSTPCAARPPAPAAAPSA